MIMKYFHDLPKLFYRWIFRFLFVTFHFFVLINRFSIFFNLKSNSFLSGKLNDMYLKFTPTSTDKNCCFRLFLHIHVELHAVFLHWSDHVTRSKNGQVSCFILVVSIVGLFYRRKTKIWFCKWAFLKTNVVIMTFPILIW